MTVRIRFFARFRELLGTDIVVDAKEGTVLSGLVKDVAGKNKEGYDAIFDEKGIFREFVIIMQNGKRVETTAARDDPGCRRRRDRGIPPGCGRVKSNGAAMIAIQTGRRRYRETDNRGKEAGNRCDRCL